MSEPDTLTRREAMEMFQDECLNGDEWDMFNSDEHAGRHETYSRAKIIAWINGELH